MSLPKINMVLHGPQTWVFDKIIKTYQKHFENKYSIICSSDPIEGCDVYQYWRPASPLAQKKMLVNRNNPFLTKGIHMLHDSPYDKKRHNTNYRLATIDRYKYTLCTSREQYEFYKNKITDSENRLKYIPLAGFENPIFNASRDTWLWKTEKIKIGFCGRLYGDGVKGEGLFPRIIKNLDPTKFEVVVQSPNADLMKKQIKRYLTHEQPIDVLLICSKYEGTPLPLIEALKAGVYVLSTPVGESPTLLSDYQICKSIPEFVNRLNAIYENRQLLIDTKKNAPSLVHDRTWDNFCAQTEIMWNDIIASSPKVIEPEISIVKEEKKTLVAQSESLNEFKVTIFIAAFKAKPWIKECLDSIINQTAWQNPNIDYEILVGIDGCEETRNELLRIRSDYPKLKIFYSSVNVGTYIMANTLIGKRSFKHLIRFDADDVMLPNLISSVYDVFNNNKNCKYMFFSFAENKVGGGQFYFHQSVLEAIGGFKPWICAADTDFTHRLKRCKELAKNNVIISQPIFNYRQVNNNSLTNSILTNRKSKTRQMYLKQIGRGPIYITPVIVKDIIEL